MVPDITTIKRQEQQANLPGIDSSTPSPSSLASSPESTSRASSASSSNSPQLNGYEYHNGNGNSNGRNYHHHQAISSRSSSSSVSSVSPPPGPQLNGNHTKTLPILFVKKQLISKISQNESLIIIGETGSGKTTQIPQFIYQAFTTRLQIGVTQPRRVAAITLAQRVATEMNTEVGSVVGYKIRFEDNTSPRTCIKFMTDGILLREATADPLLTKYRTIILDEAHERTVQIDILFGIVKAAQRIRNQKRDHEDSVKLPPLRLVVMSATMDVDHFSRYFNNAPVYYIEGRNYPIEVFYTEQPQSDYVTAALTTVFQIHQSEDELQGQQIGGDILVFCTGQEEIESMIKVVQDLAPQFNQMSTTKTRHTKSLKAYPLYASLPKEKQKLVFTRDPADCFRRVIFATNIAETSITIPNIHFVVDTGKVKSRVFLPKTGFEMMQVEDVSKAQACQRTGRAGRIAPGSCFRLYSRSHFRKLKPFPVPDIQKCNLAAVLLQLTVLDVEDVRKFDFIDPPSIEHIETSLKQLEKLGAITPKRNCTNQDGATLYQLTEKGRTMSQFPVDPRFAALILAAQHYRCTEEIIIIISMLSADNIFFVPSNEKRDLAHTIHRKFASPDGDLIQLLTIFRRFRESKSSLSWCQEHFLRYAQLRMAVQIRFQLVELCQRLSIPMLSCPQTEMVRKCLAVGLGPGVGLGANIALLQRDGQYRIVQFERNSSESSSRIVHLHPSSCLFNPNSKPECVLFVELVHTSKSYVRSLSLVDPQWWLNPAASFNHSTYTSNSSIYSRIV